MPGKLKILIADDHAIIRDGITAILQLQKDMSVVGEAQDGREAVQCAADLSPDVIIMDLRMPGMDGAEATAVIRKTNPGVRILILTSFGDSADLVRAFDNGANGAIEKTSSKEEMLAAIRKVASGGKCVSPGLERQLCETRSMPSLTDRQMEILDGLARGLSNREIAKLCGLSQAGIKFHLITIFRKLDVSNRSEAVAIALRKNLLKI